MPLASTISHRAKSLRAVKHLHEAKTIAPLNAGDGGGPECINRVTPRRRAQAQTAENSGGRGPPRLGSGHASLRCNSAVTPCACRSATKHPRAAKETPLIALSNKNIRGRRNRRARGR
jgi:hypothetical protein